MASLARLPRIPTPASASRTQGRANSRLAAATIGLVAVVTTIVLFGGPAGAGGAAPPPASSAQTLACPPHPSMLSPSGKRGPRFTMLLRVNKHENVQAFASRDAAAGGLGARIRAHDIFVVNTRYHGTTAEDARELVAMLRESFPCNRIITLNGFGADPNAPGYALALIDEPGVWGVMLDWEKRDWGAGRVTNGQMASWKRHPGRNLKRIGFWLAQLTVHASAVPGSGARRAGVMSVFSRRWNYGKVARALDGHNRRLGHRRGGIQGVMTQVACQRGGGKGMSGRAGHVLRQYGEENRKARNLALEISFSSDPAKRRALPVASVAPGTAAKCVRSGLKRGGGAFLFWASPESVSAMFEAKRVCVLRRVPRQGC